MAYLLAALGGALGALARWGVGVALPSSPTGWPWATLVVNLSGCFLLGALFAVLVTHLPDAAWPRPLLAVGVLGGFTTYSAFAVEVVRLGGAGEWLVAAGYAALSVLGGVAAVAAGTLVAHGALGRPA